MGLVLVLGSGSKTFSETTNVDYQFLFSKYSPIFLVFDLAKSCALQRYFFCPLGLFLGVWVRFKNILRTYQCRQSTLVLEVQPYLFVYISANFGAFFHFLGLSGLFFGLRSGSKTYLGPTYVDNQLRFWKYGPIFLFLILPHLGPILHFFGLFGVFLGLLGLF